MLWYHCFVYPSPLCFVLNVNVCHKLLCSFGITSSQSVQKHHNKKTRTFHCLLKIIYFFMLKRTWLCMKHVIDRNKCPNINTF